MRPTNLQTGGDNYEDEDTIVTEALLAPSPETRITPSLRYRPRHPQPHLGAPVLGVGAPVIRWIPVALLSSLIAFLYVVYIVVHCVPLLLSPEIRSRSAGIAVTILFHALFFLFFLAFMQAVLTSPGHVSDVPRDSHHSVKAHSGKRRFCKWCAAPKPARTHHCRQCGTCILRMDHHCPWICNCVGERNHKYFMLALLYAGGTLLFTALTRAPFVRAMLQEPQMSLGIIVVSLFSEGLAAGAGTVIIWYFAFHMRLVASDTTTIEHYEKKRRLPATQRKSYLQNVRKIFGRTYLYFKK